MVVKQNQEVQQFPVTEAQETLRGLEPILVLDETERMGLKVNFCLASIEQRDDRAAVITPYKNEFIDLSPLHFVGSTKGGFELEIGRRDLGATTRNETKMMSGKHARISVSSTGVVLFEDLDSTNGTEMATNFGIIHVPDNHQSVARGRHISFIIPINKWDNASLVVNVEVGPKTPEQERYTAEQKAEKLQQTLREEVKLGKPLVIAQLEEYVAFTKQAALPEQQEVYAQVEDMMKEIFDQKETIETDGTDFVIEDPKAPRRPATTIKRDVLKYTREITFRDLEDEIKKKLDELENPKELGIKFGNMLVSLNPQRK